MNIAIWGAGKFGLYVGRQLIERQNIICYIDNNAENIEDVLGIEVVSPVEYADRYSQDVDVILVAVLDYGKIREQMRRMEVKNSG